MLLSDKERAQQRSPAATEDASAYLPIEDYGIIGNLRTVALVGKNGSIDWFCFPRFDSPSVFASILDAGRGGYFRIFPASGKVNHKQIYWPDTNVLVTRFLSADGVGEIVDYMPVRPAARDEDHALLRRVKVVRGCMRFRMECAPAFNYGRDSHEIEIVSGGAKFHSPNLDLGLASQVPLKSDGKKIYAEFTLNEGHDAGFALHGLNENRRDVSWEAGESDALFQETVEFWRNWLSACTYHGRWREIVYRSALVLKLLTYAPTGAIIAAPTCSLPERIGGGRNWDYRYTWIRDAAFTVYSLLRIGFTEDATRFLSFLDARCHELGKKGSLQTVYGIDGRHDLPEEVLDGLEGYKGSSPVRIGNDAYKQLQLDINGEVMDAVYLYNKYVTPVSYDLWLYLRRIADWVAEHWKQPDSGIWEVRGGKHQFVYSKLMCWVALDRALRLASKRSFPADLVGWTKVRDEIYEDIMTRGWNEERGAFAQSNGSTALDASLLLMPLVFFLSPTDPRMLKTIDAINRSPKAGGLVSDGLVYRYDVEKTPDGLTGTEGTFSICTFWLVEALTRASRENRVRLNDALLLFEQMLGYANHVGLFGEQIGSRGETLGNFPQAFTHLALISAAYNLDQYLEGSAQGSRFTPAQEV
jgi:GH15 family glucan-1,4-alpha-glucosidase